MERTQQLRAQVTCPQCGHRFRLDDQITAQIRGDWERHARQRLLQELRAEAEQKAERKLQREHAKQLLEKDEELQAKDRKLLRVERQLVEASRKAGQKPAQDLGIVRQITLHDVLSSRFMTDEFRAVASGQRGGDLIQIVRDSSGRTSGSILWESKRGYRNWSNGWVVKLRTDQRREGCEVGVIVSDTLPSEVESSFCDLGGVVACNVAAAPYLAQFMRQRLIDLAAVRGARARRDDLKGAVYDFVCGPLIDYTRGILDKVVDMKTTLDREQRAKTAEWKQRETEIEGIALDLAAMYGDLRGIGAALPSIPRLDLAGIEPQALPAISST